MITALVFRTLALATALAVTACASSDPSAPAGPGGAPASLTITAPVPTFASLGETQLLQLTALDANGAAATPGAVTWASSDAGVVTLTAGTTPNVSARAVANGSAFITAQADGLVDTLLATVSQQLGQVTLGYGNPVVELPGDTLRIVATPRDALGSPMPGVDVTWSTASASVATVDSTGLVAAASFGGTRVSATAEAITSSVDIEVIGDRFFLNGTTRLRYDLDLPPGAGPFPAVVLVHGSGLMTRSSQRGITDPLVPEGVAALRYDKRGVGESGGTYTGVSTANSAGVLSQLAGDAVAGARFLTRLAIIDSTRIGIAANSQGGWIAPLAASQSSLISFLLIWSGPTVSVGLEIYYSNFAEGTTTPLDDAYAQLVNFNGNPGYDPMPVLEAQTIPSLWLYGEIDRSIPVRVDTLNMRTLQDLGRPFEYILFPFAGHDLRDTRTGTFVDVWGAWLSWLRAKGILTS